MRRGSRLIVVIIFLAAGAFFYWQTEATPVEHPIVFVLSGVEVPGGTGLLRHENISHLDCSIRDETGEEVATIVYNRPGAVATPAAVALPKGTYSLHITLTFQHKKGPDRLELYHRMVELKGDKTTIHL